MADKYPKALDALFKTRAERIEELMQEQDRIIDELFFLTTGRRADGRNHEKE